MFGEGFSGEVEDDLHFAAGEDSFAGVG